jgi:hypothetical protein
MANKLYPNHILENRFEDQYNSKLDLMQFCTVDNSLEGVAGDTKKINTYTATNNKTETLAMGAGNTADIEVSYETKEYKIELLQNRFPYFDEEAMNDPLVIEKGLNHMSVDMFNTANAKAMAEFNKANVEIPVTAYDFNAFVDGAAALAFEGEDVPVFALVSKDHVKEIRKNLKDTLQYVEAYVRTGYIGTVNGVSIYVSNEVADAPILATKKAVTYFSKKGTEVEQERDANIRKNVVYSRKYGIFAFTDATQAVKLVKGA